MGIEAIKNPAVSARFNDQGSARKAMRLSVTRSDVSKDESTTAQTASGSKRFKTTIKKPG